jgi:hypothetical protein
VRALTDPRDRAEILGRLNMLLPDSPRTWGRMSPHQMVCHLIDSTLVALGELTVSRVDTPINRTLVKWIALRVPLAWPPEIQTRPEIDQVLGRGTRPGEFSTDVARLTELTLRFSGERDFVGRVHPIFGEMSAKEWLRWGYLHLDHHLRQFGV